jgi:hypothetical protein
VRTKPTTFCDVCDREIRKGHLKRARRVLSTWQDWQYRDETKIEDICDECWPIMRRAALDHRAVLSGSEGGDGG